MQTMQAMTVSQARRSLAAAVDATAHGPVLIHRRKQAVAVLLSIAEYERLTQPSRTALQEFCDAVGERASTTGMTEDHLETLLHDSSDGSPTPGQPAATDRPPGDRPAWDEAWSAEADRREDRIARGESSWVPGQEAIDRLRDGPA